MPRKQYKPEEIVAKLRRLTYWFHRDDLLRTPFVRLA